MSTTYIANIVTILTLVLPHFGLHVFDQGALVNTVTSIAGIAASLYVFYGRYKAGGVSIFGIRK